MQKELVALLMESVVQLVQQRPAAAAHVIGAEVEEVVGAHAAAALRRADSSCRGLRMALWPALVLLLLRWIGCLLCWPAAMRICTKWTEVVE